MKNCLIALAFYGVASSAVASPCSEDFPDFDGPMPPKASTAVSLASCFAEKIQTYGGDTPISSDQRWSDFRSCYISAGGDGESLGQAASQDELVNIILSENPYYDAELLVKELQCQQRRLGM